MLRPLLRSESAFEWITGSNIQDGRDWIRSKMKGKMREEKLEEREETIGPTKKSREAMGKSEKENRGERIFRKEQGEEVEAEAWKRKQIEGEKEKLCKTMQQKNKKNSKKKKMV